MAALKEATDFINADKRKGTEIYLKVTGDKTTVDDIMEVLADPAIIYQTKVGGIGPFVSFMRQGRHAEESAGQLARHVLPRGARGGGGIDRLHPRAARLRAPRACSKDGHKLRHARPRASRRGRFAHSHLSMRATRDSRRMKIDPDLHPPRPTPPPARWSAASGGRMSAVRRSSRSAPTACSTSRARSRPCAICASRRSGRGVARRARASASAISPTSWPTRPRTARDPTKPWLLAPIDLQAVKAAGVTFAISLLERVIEEQARGAPERAAQARAEVESALGGDGRED